VSNKCPIYEYNEAYNRSCKLKTMFPNIGYTQCKIITTELNRSAHTRTRDEASVCIHLDNKYGDFINF